MRTIVYCFSGTGNTRRVCEGLVRELRRRGNAAELFAISADCPPPPPSGYDGVIVGYPVHAFNAPAPVLAFLKRLPAAYKPLPVWLVRTSGEPLRFNDAAGISPKRILKRKGYLIRGELSYVMPYNIIFRHPDGMATRMKSAYERNCPADAGKISAGRGETRKVGPVRRFVSFALRIEHTAAPLLGRRFKAGESCIGCGKCAEVCPQGNIRMENGKPVFGKNCSICMGCAFSCPKDAVRTSLLNGWRVNGEYAFRAPPVSDEEIGRYCRRAYLKYFHRMEQ